MNERSCAEAWRRLDTPDLTRERAGRLLVAVLGGDFEVSAKGFLHRDHIECGRRNDDLFVQYKEC